MKHTTQILRFVLAAFLLALAAPTSFAAPPNTGIQGRAALYISYGTPIEEAPGVWVGVGDVMMTVATSFTVLSAHSHHEIGHFSTDAEGNINVPLPPGEYIIVPDKLALTFGYSLTTGSFEVTVRPKEFTYALILYYQDGPLTIFSGTAR